MRERDSRALEKSRSSGSALCRAAWGPAHQPVSSGKFCGYCVQKVGISSSEKMKLILFSCSCFFQNNSVNSISILITPPNPMSCSACCFSGNAGSNEMEDNGCSDCSTPSGMAMTAFLAVYLSPSDVVTVTFSFSHCILRAADEKWKTTPCSRHFRYR